MFPQLWLCADLAALAQNELVDRVTAVLRVRPAAVWLRSAPETPARSTLEAAERLLTIAGQYGGQLWVGDRADVAVAAGACGLHVGSRGLGAAAARTLLQASRADARGPLYLSVAVHDAFSVREAARSADVLMLSPLGEVPGKAAALGAARFAAARASSPSSFVVALGGIANAADARLAARAGASAIAVRRAVLTSPHPAETCCALLDAFTVALDT